VANPGSRAGARNGVLAVFSPPADAGFLALAALQKTALPPSFTGVAALTGAPAVFIGCRSGCQRKAAMGADFQNRNRRTLP